MLYSRIDSRLVRRASFSENPLLQSSWMKWLRILWIRRLIIHLLPLLTFKLGFEMTGLPAGSTSENVCYQPGDLLRNQRGYFQGYVGLWLISSFSYTNHRGGCSHLALCHGLERVQHLEMRWPVCVGQAGGTCRSGCVEGRRQAQRPVLTFHLVWGGLSCSLLCTPGWLGCKFQGILLCPPCVSTECTQQSPAS